MKSTFFLLLSLICANCQAAEPPPGSRETFLKNGCWQCHGTVGQGSIAAPRLDPDRLPYIAFAAMVRNPARAMPPFSETILSDSELRQIYEYLKDLPPSPAPANIPLLKP